MAVSEEPTIISMIAGATFSSGDVYKFVVATASGEVVLPNTTGNVLPLGVLYGRTQTTGSSGVEAVPVAIDGVMSVRMAASTIAAGDYVGSSTAGVGIAPSSDGYTFGIVVKGSSGGANRVVSVARLGVGPLNTP